MKKLMFFALALGLLGSCGNSKSAKELLAAEDSLAGDTLIEIIGEWVEVPVTGEDVSQSPKTVKFNRDNTMEGTPVEKKVKKMAITKNVKNAKDSVAVTTMLYQAWDQFGDTLTIIEQSAVDPELQDTITWGIVSLTSDSLQLNSPTQGTKNYVRKK